MSQHFPLVSTSRIAPSLLRTAGDTEVTSGRAVPIAVLAMFEPDDVQELPWSASMRQLTLFTRKDLALARLVRWAPTLVAKLVEDVGGNADAAVLAGAIENLRASLARAPGDHVQVFLSDSYAGWTDRQRAELVQLLEGGQGRGDGWADAIAYWELQNRTLPPPTLDVLRYAVVGDLGNWGHHDALAEALADDDFSAQVWDGAIVFALEQLASTHAQPRLGDALGAVSCLLGADVALRVSTSAGDVAATLLPDLAIPAGCLAPLAQWDAASLFAALTPLWQLAALGAFADGPVTCTALAIDRRAPAPSVPAAYPPVEPAKLAPIERRPDFDGARAFGAVPEEEREAFLASRSPAQRSGIYDAMKAKYAIEEEWASELPAMLASFIEPEPEAQLHWLAVFDGDAIFEVALAHPDPRARVELIDLYYDGLAADINDQLVKDPSPAVRCAIARALRSETSGAVADEHHPVVRAARAEAYEHILLAGHPDLSVRTAVAGAVSTPARTRISLAADREPTVRAATCFPLIWPAGNRAMEGRAETARLRLARDESVEVRLELVDAMRSAGVENNLLRAILLADPDPLVAQAAAKLRVD